VERIASRDELMEGLAGVVFVVLARGKRPGGESVVERRRVGLLEEEEMGLFNLGRLSRKTADRRGVG